MESGTGKASMQSELTESSAPQPRDKAEQRLWWRREREETLADYKLFSVRRVTATNEELLGLEPRSFYKLSFAPWVNVVPITTGGEVVMVEQFRHGVQHLTLELPGGMIDPTDESPLQAAKRELLEETGYIASQWREIGVNHPNPAIQTNLCYTQLAREATFAVEPQFDETGTEVIRTRLVPLCEITSLIKAGVITHALVLAAFHFLAIEDREAGKLMGFYL